MEDSVEARVCAACGARNPAGVDWCGQCYQRFEETFEVAPAVPQEPPQPRTVGALAGDGPPAPPGAPQETEVVVGVAEPQWECRLCGTSNPMEASRCGACGTTIFETFGARPDREQELAPSNALGWSLVFPGLGHGKAGQGMLGVAIGLLTAMAVAFGTMLGLGMGRAVWGSLLLLLALGVWGVAAMDAYHWAAGRGEEVLLRPRVVSVLSALMLVLLVFGLTQSPA
ncbi:MAG: zinc finger Ran-binding domain-containing protein [Actinomycetota bacterium]|nr:zinc finger Ran-binding domain-containing protein [Actinomycetota bacterium]